MASHYLLQSVKTTIVHTLQWFFPLVSYANTDSMHSFFPLHAIPKLRLLGMAQYVAKFVPHFSEITKPLRGLLAKDSEFRWTDTHSKALHDLKQLLVSTPTLGYYDVTKPIKIQTDASSSGLGCVCMQDGKPIEYASRALTPTERDSYCQLEKELLAVCWALSRYHYHCYGKSDVTV